MNEQIQKKSWFRKDPILTVILVIFGLGLIVNIFSAPEDKTKPKEEAPVVATQPQTFEDRIKALAVRTGVTDISYNGIDDEKADPDRPAGSRMITVKLNATSIYNADSFYRNTGELSGKIFQETFASNPNAYDVIVWYYGDATDQYGNTKKEVLLSQLMDRKTYEKINWANFDSTKLCDFLYTEGTRNKGETSCSKLVQIK